MCPSQNSKDLFAPCSLLYFHLFYICSWRQYHHKKSKVMGWKFLNHRKFLCKALSLHCIPHHFQNSWWHPPVSNYWWLKSPKTDILQDIICQYTSNMCFCYNPYLLRFKHFVHLGEMWMPFSFNYFRILCPPASTWMKQLNLNKYWHQLSLHPWSPSLSFPSAGSAMRQGAESKV